MPSGHGERFDFFLSRRGSVAGIAEEVTRVLEEKGYEVCVQDYDIPLTANFIEKMHEFVKNARDLVVLFTRDYEQSPYTRMEFTSFEANAAQSSEKRRMVILRCEDAPLLGLFASHVYQDLVGIADAGERKSRILAAAEGCSQALESPPRPFIGVPPRIASFTGRADELDRLDAILMQDKPAAVTQASVGRAAVQGMGGVGKTSLAIEYAHRFRGLYAGVCWCPAETRAGLLSALASLAVTLGVSEEAHSEKTAKAALRRLAEQRATWLFVYDNVTAPDHIINLLPSAGARVLITSRFSDWSELADEVALDMLPPEEAVALLESRTGRKDAEGARILAEALGNLPLALDHAAAYCRRTQMQFGDYGSKASSLIDAAPRGAGYPRSVSATFNLAIAEAVARCQGADTLMAYLAHCAPERIPMTLVEGALEDVAERFDAVAALAEVSLLKHDPFDDGTPGVTVHRLVQAVARARSEARGLARHATKQLQERLAAIYPGVHDPPEGELKYGRKLSAHLKYLMDNRKLFGVVPSRKLLDRTLIYSIYSLRRNADLRKALDDFAGARSEYETALALSEKSYGPESPVTATMLATLLRDQGDLAGARSHYERALALHERTCGPEHLDTAMSLHDLATVLKDQGDLTEARSHYERALAIRAKALDPDHLDIAKNLQDLATVLKDQGDLTEARSRYERVLAIRDKVLGPENPFTRQIVGELARLLLFGQAPDLAAARPLVERLIATYEEGGKIWNADVAIGFMDYIVAPFEKGRDLRDARILYERALAMSENALGPDHSATNRARGNLARMLLMSAQPTETLALGETALTAHDKVLGRDHAWTQDSARVTAEALDALGRIEEAKALRKRYGVANLEKPKSARSSKGATKRRRKKANAPPG
jgi:tetratricopeptide (TPR) repeat protein